MQMHANNYCEFNADKTLNAMMMAEIENCTQLFYQQSKMGPIRGILKYLNAV